jgi:uncharacterized protein YbjT (DUF2867 family)/membrane protease YdiL (CAAX protease family)
MTSASAGQSPSTSGEIRTILVAGATGFVGRHLVPALVRAGYDVRAMTRHPETYGGPCTPVRGDVHEPDSLTAAFEGVDAAYYLVHSLDSPDFERLDREAAQAFGRAAAEAGVKRIVYHGGLGSDQDTLSAHLRSRREVEKRLGEAGVPVTTLRAGIVIGHNGLSWEMTRQLVERLPMMITPRWVRTRTQPIALSDVVRYLVGVLKVPETAGRPFEIGGPDVLSYAEMMRRVAISQGRTILVLPVPVLSPHLSSHWLNLVTDVDTAAGRSLVDSMVNEVVVKDDELHHLVPFHLRTFEEAVKEALDEREEELARATGWKARLRGKLPMSLSYKVPVRHEESPEVRRHRRRVVLGTSVVGAGLLGFGLNTRPGSAAFYGATLATAGIYTAGGLASGPLHLGWIQLQDRSLNRPIITPILTGAGAFGVFYVGAHLVKLVPPLGKAVATVLQFADGGDERLLYLTTLSNGVAEEIFFRGAVYATLQDLHPTLTSTAVYMVATIPTRNPMLVFAAGLMGLLWGAQRRSSNGLQAPVLTHLTWSSLMLRYLPPVFADVVPEQTRGSRAEVMRHQPAVVRALTAAADAPTTAPGLLRRVLRSTRG